MGPKSFTLVFVFLVGVLHVIEAANITIGTVPNKPFAYAEDGIFKGLAVDVLNKVYNFNDDMKKNTPQFNEIDNGIIGMNVAGKAWKDGLIKDLIAGKDGMQMGAAGVMQTDELTSETDIVLSYPYLMYNVTMLMATEHTATSIMDANTNNLTLIVIENGPVHKMFTKCATLVTDAKEKAACTAIKDLFASEKTRLVADAAKAVEAVTKDKKIWVTDGACATFFSNNLCGLKAVDGGMFPKDSCKFVFPIKESEMGTLKTKLDTTLKAKAMIDDIKKIATKYLVTVAKDTRKETCGTSGLTYAIATLIVSIFVSKIL